MLTTLYIDDQLPPKPQKICIVSKKLASGREALRNDQARSATV
jgi:hypothetical protein